MTALAIVPPWAPAPGRNNDERPDGLPDYTYRDIKRTLRDYAVLYDRQVDLRPVPSNVLLNTEEDWWLEGQIIISADIERAMTALEQAKPWAYRVLLYFYVGGWEWDDVAAKCSKMNHRTVKREHDAGMEFLESYLNGGVCE